jgi:hypothetical protein
MSTRGWGIARKRGFASGGFNTFEDPAPTKAPEVNAKPEFTTQRVNRPKTHHTPTNAVNLPHTQRKPWQKLE